MWTVLLAAALAAGQPATGGRLHGVVLDRAGGAPIARVAVRVQSSGDTVVTGDDGRFEFADVAPGDHELYVSAVDFILVRRRLTVTAGAVTDITIVLTEGSGTYAESVDVRAAPASSSAAPPAEGRLRGIDLLQLSGGMASDPLRAVQALAGVTASDDFRGEFAVRGAGPRQIGFVFEGVQTPVLLHTVQQVQDAGSVAMVSGLVLEEVNLRNGSYPQRHGNRTGAELEFTMREGTRDHVRASASASLIDASALAEGPIGGGRRGAWLVAVRRSYMDLLLKRIAPDQQVNFAFYDGQTKATYDLSPSHRVEVAATAGRSSLDLSADAFRNPNNLETADSRGGVGIVTWRYLPAPTWSLTQRAAMTRSRYRNVARSGPVLDEGEARALIYRPEWLYAPRAGLRVEGGGEARWASGAAAEQRIVNGRPQVRQRFTGRASSLSAFAIATLSVRSRLTVSPGLRVDRWSLTRSTAASPWATARWQLSDRLAIRAGGGIYQQPPGFSEVLGTRGTEGLRPERAGQVDIGVDGTWPGGLAWRVTGYQRRERDMLRLPDVEPRWNGTQVVFGSLTSHWRNALSGSVRGVEWLLERRRRNGISGWIAYAWGRTRYRDVVTGETFWGDVDQRHTVSAFATYRTSDRMSVGVRARAGSNTPAPGYWTEVNGQQLVSDVRNTLRVPGYGRLDVRVDRTFTWTRRRLTLFVDLLNATGRHNVRYLPPSVDRRTRVASGMFEGLVPRVPSLGALLEF